MIVVARFIFHSMILNDVNRKRRRRVTCFKSTTVNNDKIYSFTVEIFLTKTLSQYLRTNMTLKLNICTYHVKTK